MHLTRKIIIQMAVFALVSLLAGLVMIFAYVQLPNLLFGVGHYKVTLLLPESGGLYKAGNVTYRGTEVGRVESVGLTDTGAEAVLSLKSDFKIPADLEAQVHSQSAIGEQFVALLPRTDSGPYLKDGSVIPEKDASVPPDINALLDATTRGLQAIPGDNLKTAIDEAYIAFGGLGPEISRFVKGSTALAIDAQKNLDSLTQLIDQSEPVLNSQTDSADSLKGWADHVATISQELKEQDSSVQGILNNSPAAADEVKALFDRLQPTLPTVLANLTSIYQVAIVYQPNIEQTLVLAPVGMAALQGGIVANMGTKLPGAYLDFDLNINIPPACTTGYLPASQQRGPTYEDAPARPPGEIYCATPQDSPYGVRSAKNYPCETVPGKRAPTVKQCESPDPYVPLNDGMNWKGDPNATLSGQDIPNLAASPTLPPALRGAAPAAAPPTPIAAANYDPATGTYVGPDGKVYTQANLAQGAHEEQTWQTMLLPPKGN